VTDDQGHRPPSKRTRRKKCGAKNKRNGKPCDRWALKGKNRCRQHGGATPTGAALPQFKHGNRATHMPADLQKLVVAASADPDLMRLRNDLAEIEGLLAKLHGSLKPNKAVPYRTEQRILGLLDLRRKTIDSEAKRLRDLHQMIPAERFIRAMQEAATITVEVFRLFAAKVGEPPEVWLAMIRDRYARVSTPAAIETTAEVEEGA